MNVTFKYSYKDYKQGSNIELGSGSSIPNVIRYSNILTSIECKIVRRSAKHQSCSVSQKTCKFI